MKKWVKSPAVWGMVILFLVSAGIIIYLGTEMSRLHGQMAELELQLSALDEEVAELREKAEAEDFAQKEAEQAEKPVQETVKPQSGQAGKPVQNKPVQPVSKYVSEDKVKESILGDLQYDDNPEDLVFVSIALDETQTPPVYDVIAETADKYRKHIYKVNAETGLIRDRVFYNADNFDEEGQIGLYHERGDSSEPEAWNQYWELYCSPSGQVYHEGIPVIEIYTDEWYAYEEAR
ncbi:MAG: hypothetical protein IKV72_02985 [Firmicutes bacterium]|nr:hypothetical protein [Bacillota bacterium]